jgi:DNA-binding GntR family transcriptional regulator
MLQQRIRETFFCPKAAGALPFFPRIHSPSMASRYLRLKLPELSGDDHIRLHEEHFRFHMRIAECSGHSALSQAIERHQILTFNWLYDTAANRIHLPARHHGVLAEILAQHDPEKADAAMRAHVMYGCEELLRRFEPRYLVG